MQMKPKACIVSLFVAPENEDRSGPLGHPLVRPTRFSLSSANRLARSGGGGSQSHDALAIDEPALPPAHARSDVAAPGLLRPVVRRGAS